MIVFTQEEAIEQGAKYRKECFICGKEFWSTARNTKYCCEECAEKALKKVNKRNKVRRVRRKAYDANKEINRALSQAYGLAHKIADLYKIPKKCSCTDEGHECKGPIQLHHRNLNPFDNSPGNLGWYCASGHKSEHDKLGDVNMVEVYKQALEEAGFEEEENKHKVMISYTKRKIEDALNEARGERQSIDDIEGEAVKFGNAEPRFDI